MVFLYFRLGLRLYVIPNWPLQELEGAEDYYPLSKVNTLIGCRQANQHLSPHLSPQGQAPKVPHA